MFDNTGRNQRTEKGYLFQFFGIASKSSGKGIL
jgi:hypothetical protein